MRALAVGVSWQRKAPSKAAQLRELLSDGLWHGQQRIQGVAGMRFGARLFDLHNELDVGSGLTPVHYETRRDVANGTRVEYRQADKAHCDICTAEDRKRPSVLIEELREENAKLRERVRRLEMGALATVSP